MPPPFPDVDESKFARVVVEFLSKTPPMAYFCSRIDVLPDCVRLEAEWSDGSVRRVVDIGRERVRRLVVDFDLHPLGFDERGD